MIEVHKVSPHIGAEVKGVNVGRIDDATFATIYKAFLDHVVVVIRGQKLTEEQYMNYSMRFGELKAHIVRKQQHPKYPLMMLMDNMAEGEKTGKPVVSKQSLVKRGAVWHTDLSYEHVSGKATQLYSIAIPSSGGDTLFANSYLAYERLPAGMKRRLEGLSGTYRYGGRLKRGVDLLEKEDREREPAIHPLIRIHPETGRKTLYFDGGKILQILGVSAAESDELIAFLDAHTNVEPDYRHKWQLGDIVIWDNRCSLHSATGDAPPNERRAFWRFTIMEPGWQQRERRSA